MVTGIGNFRLERLSICIPYRGIDSRREQIFDWICERYRILFPDCQLIVADSDKDKDFNRSEARNNAAKMARNDFLYFADADTLTYPDQIDYALGCLFRDSAQWVVTQNTYFIANNETTDFILSRSPKTRDDFRDMPMLDTLRDGVSVAGGYLVTREQYDSVKGFDERFVGWGYEDTAFLMSMETLWDYSLRIKDSYVMHLEHPAIRFDSPDIGINEQIFKAYQDAQGDREGMLRVIHSR